MSFPSLPDWLPWWAALIVLVPVGLWALTMLVMPFSVIGVKARLEGIDARLDEVQSEIRSLALRLPEIPGARLSYRDRDDPAEAPPIDQRYVQPAAARPPIPPAPQEPAFIRRPPPSSARPDRVVARTDRPAEPMQETPVPSPRAEPRFDWRR